MGVDLVLKRQIFRLLLPQTGDFLAVKPLFDVGEKGPQYRLSFPVPQQNGLKVPVIPLAPEGPPQLNHSPQPHGFTYLYSFL